MRRGAPEPAAGAAARAAAAAAAAAGRRRRQQAPAPGRGAARARPRARAHVPAHAARLGALPAAPLMPTTAPLRLRFIIELSRNEFAESK